MDLLDTINDDKAGGAAVVDLLDGLGEGDDSAAWMPEPGDGVQGQVVSRSTTQSKFKNQQGTFTTCPVLVLALADGSKVRVTGYQSVLRKEIEEADPQVGDLFAAKYFGRKSTKDGSGEYHHYKVAVKPGARSAAGKGQPPF